MIFVNKLVDSLRDVEVALLETLLKLEGRELEIKLLRHLKRGIPNEELKRVGQLIYRETFEPSKYSHLKSRLRDCILRVLAVRVGLPEHSLSKVIIDRQRSLISASSLYNYLQVGNHELAREIIDEEIERCDGNCLLEESILFKAKRLRLFHDKGDSYRLLSRSLVSDLESLARSSELRSLVNHMAEYCLLGPQFIKPNELESLKNEVVPNLDMEHTDSGADEYRLRLQLSFMWAYVTRDRGLMRKANRKLDEFGLSSGQSTDRGGAFLLAGNLSTLLGNYDQAQLQFENALSQMKNGSPNWLNVALRLRRLSLLRGSVSDVDLGQFLASSSDTNYSFDEREYYISLYELFVSRQFETCIQACQEGASGYMHRIDFRIGVKIIELLTFLELGQFDFVDVRFDSFRKLLYKKSVVANRAKTTLKILKAAVKSAMDFNLVATKHADDLALLRSGEGEYFWDPLGYEIIRFDEWFDRKVAEQNKKGRRRNSVKRRLKVSGA